jgi:subtilisin family serine protease
MATPHVTGLAALAVAKGASSPDAVRAALKAAATPIAGLTADEQGAGIIDAAKLK